MEMRGQKNRKEVKIKIGKQVFGFAAVNGLINARTLLDEIENGRTDIHLVEVMACPSGCINGGGQRFGTDEKSLKSRYKAIYDSDDEEMIRVAHKNPAITAIYEEFLEKPLSEKCKMMIHKPTEAEQKA
jgi:iron only hydrogenase large subunit-like protein